MKNSSPRNVKITAFSRLAMPVTVDKYVRNDGNSAIAAMAPQKIVQKQASQTVFFWRITKFHA